MSVNGAAKFQAIKEQLLEELELRQYEIEHDKGATSFFFKVFVGEHDGQPFRVVFQKESKREIPRKTQVVYR